MLLITACKKENISTSPEASGDEEIVQTRMWGDDGPVDVEPDLDLEHFEFVYGLGGNIFSWEYDANFDYTSLSFLFNWYPLIDWDVNNGPIPDFTFEIFQIDCDTEEIIGPAFAIPLASVPVNASNSYSVELSFIHPLSQLNCYILEITTPYGTKIYRRIFI